MAETTSLLLLLSLTATVTSFSFHCNKPYRACYLQSLQCVPPTEAGRGECPHDNPVLSEDGKSCSKCDGDFCPECEEYDYYCKATKKCQKKTAPCGGECLLVGRYPNLNENGTECEYCKEGTLWCAEEKRCYRQAEGEPCNGTCHQPDEFSAWRTERRLILDRYCPETGLCQSLYVPCGGKCAEDTYCSQMNPVKDPRAARLLSEVTSGFFILSSV